MNRRASQNKHATPKKRLHLSGSQRDSQMQCALVIVRAWFLNKGTYSRAAPYDVSDYVNWWASLGAWQR
eukprot:1171303-Alexandrium_andersonii.AAC.1